MLRLPVKNHPARVATKTAGNVSLSETKCPDVPTPADVRA